MKENSTTITINIREGKGTIGKLFSDTTFANTVDEALVYIKQGAGGFKQNMNAASHNFLLKGFLRKRKNNNSRSRIRNRYSLIPKAFLKLFFARTHLVKALTVKGLRGSWFGKKIFVQHFF